VYDYMGFFRLEFMTALFLYDGPVMTALVMLAILFFGVVSYRKACRVGFCRVIRLSRPFRCRASLPGASPETMAASVATILERQFSTVSWPGPDVLLERPGDRPNVTLQFELDRNIDAAAQDVQKRDVQRWCGGFRPNMPAPPQPAESRIRRDQAILFMGYDPRPRSSMQDGGTNTPRR